MPKMLLAVQHAAENLTWKNPKTDCETAGFKKDVIHKLFSKTDLFFKNAELTKHFLLLTVDGNFLAVSVIA